ncbi:MAG: hypothetical protein DIU78_011170 [Pseudomonadota bacterium]
MDGGGPWTVCAQAAERCPEVVDVQVSDGMSSGGGVGMGGTPAAGGSFGIGGASSG